MEKLEICVLTEKEVEFLEFFFFLCGRIGLKKTETASFQRIKNRDLRKSMVTTYCLQAGIIEVTK